MGNLAVALFKHKSDLVSKVRYVDWENLKSAQLVGDPSLNLYKIIPIQREC